MTQPHVCEDIYIVFIVTRILFTYIFLAFSLSVLAQTYTLSGTVLDRKSGDPVEFATVVLERSEQWAVADSKGQFTIKNIQSGKNVISISCLGYVTDTREITISKDIQNYKVSLAEDNLTLETVVVTAQENDNSATTSRTIDKTALDHIQMLNVADVSGLLPGGQTVNTALTSEQRFNIRAGALTEEGNASFGTAVEVDGVRISGNASFADASLNGIRGITTNNIGSANVESIEVISGVPSVEYGDMTSGIVKINTKKGKTPFTVTMSSNPRTKQVSVSKGFGLGTSGGGRQNGVLNVSAEYTKSISELMSPYTSYDRKQLSVTYSNLFSSGILNDAPLKFSAGVTGNIGGKNTKADPDTFKDTFSIARDNSFRGNFSFSWLLSKSWITNLELTGSVSYSDKLERTNKNYSSASSTIALHGREEGYFVAQDYETNPDAEVILIPRGYWYNVLCTDDRPLNYKIGIKANWAKQLGKLNNKVKLGADWTGDKNFGIGTYSEDMSNAPTFREYRYCDIPFMNNLAVYIEDNLMIPVGSGRLNIIAGIRNDNTFIKGSVYGSTSSWSPRFNVKYTVFSPKDRRDKFVKELSFRASWGVAVKQPSYSVLYPTPTYRDISTFVPTSSSDGSAYYAYYIIPKTIEYNPQLRWQKNRQSEIGMEIDLDGYRISLAGYFNRTFDAYRLSKDYESFSYNYTDGTILQSVCTIPADNRSFSVDNRTGIVTVYDKTGVQEPEVMPYKTKQMLLDRTFANNADSPTVRYGVEWIIDFKRIKPINTTVRLDGSFYGYRTLDTNTEAYSSTTLVSADGSPYKYVGYYYGGNSIANGSETRNLNTNLTITTHIPKIRLILSLKMEAGLIKYSRSLSDKADGSRRTYVISDKNDILSFTDAGIYDGNSFTVMFPDTYSSIDNPEPREFLPDLLWAKENDPQMYTDLSRLAVTSSYIYWFAKDYISPYFSANFSITKEIGDIASLSLYANNFFNNSGQVTSTKTGNKVSVSGHIPSLFYGLSLRLKF